jgi:hypothetical protein
MRYCVILAVLLQLATAADPAPKDQDCKKLSGDAGWPAPDVWAKALPGVIPREQNDPKVTRPDYQLVATSISQVQAAVKFAADNNIRLSILNSAHDFLGRLVLSFEKKKKG